MELFKVTKKTPLSSTSSCTVEVLVSANLFNNICYLQCRNGDFTNAKSKFTNEQGSRDHKEIMIQEYKHISTIYYNIMVVNAMLVLEESVMVLLAGSRGLQKFAFEEHQPDNGNLDTATAAFLKTQQTIHFAFGNDDFQIAKGWYHIGKIH